MGYTINDPVLRYMMDALAADRMLGETTPQAYAFGATKPGQEDEAKEEWVAKGVMPILYEMSGKDDHSLLHATLREWASTYRDGILGKERIVVDYALARPSSSTKQDDFVGRMLWALSDPSGLPAKRFAEFDPAPPLDWLDAFFEERFRHCDLVRFGVMPNAQDDPKLGFSIAHRPSPYTLGSWMEFVSGFRSRAHWDEVMFQLARWLLRHLNDPKLILTLSSRGGRLHDRFQFLLEQQLTLIATLQESTNTSELNELKAKSPNSFPRPFLSTVWRLFLTGNVKSPWLELDLYDWRRLLKRDGLTFSVRREFRRLLSPKISLKMPFRWPLGEEEEEAKEEKRALDWSISLSTDHARTAIREFSGGSMATYLPDMFSDIEQLLLDTLDLSAELDGASDQEDTSSWHLPSIKDHWQNRGFEDWVFLVELARDAWSAINSSDASRAAALAESWFLQRYPTFKRLALYAATQNEVINPSIWVRWLTSNNGWWLWSIHTKREVMRILVERGSKLTQSTSLQLENAILRGPPRRMYKDSITQKDWRDIRSREIWLRLAKLRQGQGRLGRPANQRFRDLSLANPDWKLTSNERDEFWHWMSGTGDPDYEDRREVDVAPNRREALVDWLRRPPKVRGPFYEDTWSQQCRSRFFLTFAALCDLSREGLWPVDRWSSALQGWGDPSKARLSWRFAASLVAEMPDSAFEEVGTQAAWWLEQASKTLRSKEDTFIELSRRVLSLNWDSEEDDKDSVFHAINHPTGLITQGLLNVWFDREPNDNQGLPSDLKPIFTELTDRSVRDNKHARVVLASRVISLFRVDKEWTEVNLLPAFSWYLDEKAAKGAWQGLLWSPRLYWPLFLALKVDFLKTAKHYDALGDGGRQYAALLTIAALEPADGFEPADFATAVSALPQDGLLEVAQTLAQSLLGAGDRRESYWVNRVAPFWKKIWPKSRDLRSSKMSESLARLVIAADQAFPDALLAISDWLLPIEHPHYIIHLFDEQKLASRFPKETLEFLTLVNSDHAWPSEEMRTILDDIVATKPNLVTDGRFVQLDTRLRQANL